MKRAGTSGSSTALEVVAPFSGCSSAESCTSPPCFGQVESLKKRVSSVKRVPPGLLISKACHWWRSVDCSFSTPPGIDLRAYDWLRFCLVAERGSLDWCLQTSNESQFDSRFFQIIHPVNQPVHQLGLPYSYSGH